MRSSIPTESKEHVFRELILDVSQSLLNEVKYSNYENLFKEEKEMKKSQSLLNEVKYSNTLWVTSLT